MENTIVALSAAYTASVWVDVRFAAVSAVFFPPLPLPERDK